MNEVTLYSVSPGSHWGLIIAKQVKYYFSPKNFKFSQLVLKNLYLSLKDQKKKKDVLKPLEKDKFYE